MINNKNYKNNRKKLFLLRKRYSIITSDRYEFEYPHIKKRKTNTFYFI